MHPTPAWAVYRDAKTGRLMRKYISSGDGKSPSPKQTDHKNKRP